MRRDEIEDGMGFSGLAPTAAERRQDAQTALLSSRGSMRRDAIADAAAYLSTLAEQLDKWAEESRTGGWSTHQVTGNTAMADSCRRMADKLRRTIQ